MNKFKVFIIAVILVCTFASILYLSYIAKQMERYSMARNDGGKCFVIVSTSGGKLTDDPELGKLLAYAQDSLNNAGYDAVIIKSNDNLMEKLKDSMKKNKKYFLIDIDSTKLLISANAVILRIGNNENPKYSENIKYAQFIKDNIKGIKVNIISDTKNNYYQDIAYKALRIEISEKSNYDKASNCISEIFKFVIQ